jgi:hypothetical protein
MSLSFPASPSVGQIYQGFAWDGARWTSPWGGGSLVNSFNGRTGAVTPQTGDETSGNKTLLATTVISTPVASVDFFSGFDGTYDQLELHYYDVAQAGAVENGLGLRVSTDGSTFDAGSFYFYSYSYTTPLTAITSSGGNLVAGIALGVGNPLASAPQRPSYNHVKIRPAPAGGNPFLSLFFQGVLHNAAAGQDSFFGAGTYSPTVQAQSKGIRIYVVGANNLSRGTFKLYGIVK